MPDSLPTFGIVTFQRRAKLLRLVESIRRFYPDSRIVIADNGQLLPAQPKKLAAADIDGCLSYVLPFDCGLSAARNFLVGLTEGDLLILDDDFEFIPETNIRGMQEILHSDDSIGIVCGDAGVTRPMKFVGNPRLGQTTPVESEEPVVPCDISDNFMLVRRAVFQDGLRWSPALKVGEHRDFFEKVADTKWKVVHAPGVKVRHHQLEDDTAEYTRYRQRAAQLRTVMMPREERPPIVVLGVGHSGTRLVVRMIEALGWQLGETKQVFAENRLFQSINKRILLSHGICPCGSDSVQMEEDQLDCKRCNCSYAAHPVDEWELPNALLKLPAPWCIKDPRLVLTWDYWRPVLEYFHPLLVLIERDREAMRRTYQRHGFRDFRIYGRSVDDLLELARGHFATWTGAKVRINYADLVGAARCVDFSRAGVA